MTLENFVSGIQGFDEFDQKLQTDLLALYMMEYESGREITATVLESLRSQLHLSAHPRLARYLSEQTTKNNARQVRYTKKPKGYSLERSYYSQLKATHLGRKAATHVTHSLRTVLSSISDQNVRSYLEEAITCFEQNLLRSSIILTWCVVYGLFRAWLYNRHLHVLNSIMANWKNPIHILKIDDFQDIVDSVVIETARKANLITKEQHKTLKHLLDQRNSYAHPTGKVITPSIAEAYIETAINDAMLLFM